MRGAELKAMASWIAQNVQDEEPVLLVFPRREAKKRIANAGPKPKTRLVKDLLTAEAYSDWHKEFDRYYEFSGNPHIALDIMLRQLQQLNEQMIRSLAEDEQKIQGLGDA